jgi:putative membrane protein
VIRLLLEIILFTLLGIPIGVIAGLTPGIHVNTLIPMVLALSTFIVNPYYLAVLIVSVAITEMFVDYIPSIFLGAPEVDTSLSVLPGHRLLLEGRGREAIKLTIIGSIGGLISSLVLVAFLMNYFKFFYVITRPYIHYAILLVMIFMVFSERKLKSVLSATLILLMSGFLGIVVLNSSLVDQQNALFPTLTGLFGLSTLIISVSERTKIPKQKEESKLQISRKDIVKAIILSSLAGVVVGFLPAIGISEAATIVQYLGGMGEARNFLVTVSGINAANDAFSLVSLYLVKNPRSGASVAIQRIMSELMLFDVLLLIGTMLFAAGLAAIISLCLGEKIPKYLERVDYKKLCLSVIVLVTVMIFLLTGLFGLLIAFTSTSIGILSVRLGIRRSHCMGVLLVPTVLFFAGLNPVVLNVLSI